LTLRDDERQFHQGAIPERRRCVRELVRPDRLPNPVLAAARSQVITGVTWVRRPVDAGGNRGANASLGGVVPGRQTADAESRALPLRFWHGRYPSICARLDPRRRSTYGSFSRAALNGGRQQ
jgi:hypothetical protein